MLKGFIIYIALLFSCVTLSAQEFIPLWPEGKKPNSNEKKITDSLYNERIWRVATPGMYSFMVPKSENKGTTVLICPGGGYERLSHIYNGFQMAKWFNSIGINALVLIYRLPHQTDLLRRQEAPVQDAQRAIKIIRSNAAIWNINANRIGVMGVSAGGHVATSLGTSTIDLSLIKDNYDTISYRPDFMILLSPVVTMGTYAHQGSKTRFLGPDTSAAMIMKYSNELQVTSTTPPAFIVHAMNDSTVNVRNSLMFYAALLDKKVNGSLHIFPQGGHGIRLDDNPGSTDLWLDLLEKWLKETGFVAPIPFK